MPNAFAFLVMFISPVFVLILLRKYRAATAVTAAVVGGYLLLPNGTGINFPLLPTINKQLVPSASTLLFCLLGLAMTGAAVGRDALRRGAAAMRRAAPRRRARETAEERPPDRVNPWIPGLLIGQALLLLFLLRPFATVLTNGDPQFFGPTFLPPQRLYDAFSFTLTQMVVILPFILGHRYLGGEEGQRTLLLGLVVAALAYSALMLIEIRLSPQLHKWIYGFFPHGSFQQQVRNGGYRPVVFLSHGLWVAIFAAMGFLAAAAAWRGATGVLRGRLALATGYLLVVLVLCKSFGALLIALILAPVARLFTPRLAVLTAAAVSGAILLYPALRGADLVPTQQILSAVASLDDERAASLGVRLRNEDLLLARANLRPVFGWGGYGRSRIFDAVSGRDVTIADGRWIILIGIAGWVGYIAEYGLLCAPILIFALGSRRYRPSAATAGLCVVLTANIVDMIPNGTITVITWLCAGALFGRLTAAKAEAREARRGAARTGRSRSPAPQPGPQPGRAPSPAERAAMRGADPGPGAPSTAAPSAAPPAAPASAAPGAKRAGGAQGRRSDAGRRR